jgi:hypothetical protein
LVFFFSPEFCDFQSFVTRRVISDPLGEHQSDGLLSRPTDTLWEPHSEWLPPTDTATLQEGRRKVTGYD